MSYARSRAKGISFGLSIEEPETKTSRGRVFRINMLRLENKKYVSSSEAVFDYSEYENAHKDYIEIKGDIIKRMFPKEEFSDKELDEWFVSDKDSNGIEIRLESLMIKGATLYSVIIEEDITPKEGVLNNDFFFYNSSFKCKKSYLTAIYKLKNLHEKYISKKYL